MKTYKRAHKKLFTKFQKYIVSLCFQELNFGFEERKGEKEWLNPEANKIHTFLFDYFYLHFRVLFTI